MSPLVAVSGCPKCRLYSTSAARPRVPPRSPMLLSVPSRRPPSHPSLSSRRQTCLRNLTTRNNPARTLPKPPAKRAPASSRTQHEPTSTPTKICAAERFSRRKMSRAPRRQITKILQHRLLQHRQMCGLSTPTQRRHKNRSATSHAATATPKRLRRSTCRRTSPHSPRRESLRRWWNPIPIPCCDRIQKISSPFDPLRHSRMRSFPAHARCHRLAWAASTHLSVVAHNQRPRQL